MTLTDDVRKLNKLEKKYAADKQHAILETKSRSMSKLDSKRNKNALTGRGIETSDFIELSLDPVRENFVTTAAPIEDLSSSAPNMRVGLDLIDPMLKKRGVGILQLYSPHCGGCQKMDIIFKDIMTEYKRRVPEKQRFPFYKVNVNGDEYNEQANALFGAEFLPSFYVMQGKDNGTLYKSINNIFMNDSDPKTIAANFTNLLVDIANAKN